MRNDIGAEKNDEIFKIIQNFLKEPPVVIWGSGATIPIGMPSMSDLNERLKEKIEGFDTKNTNLEIELGKDIYRKRLPQIKRIIRDRISESDRTSVDKIINKDSYSLGIKKMMEKFCDAHPCTLNIVTTNYDRILEYVMSYYDIPFTDGFTGRTLSCFNESLFDNRQNKLVKLVKVHGSLNWFKVNDEIRYLSNGEKYEPDIVTPGKNKYQETFNSPYRELIQESDSLIKTAKGFLVVGFGFNDEHLTPRIRNQTSLGIPIVVITKKITDTTRTELKRAAKYIFIEENNIGATRISYKVSASANPEECCLDGSIWQLPEFMEVL